MPDQEERLLKIREYGRQGARRWRVKHRKEPKYILKERIRLSIQAALVRRGSGKRGRHWEDLVGYKLKELEKHLRSTIPKGYTWRDFLDGELWIDHKIPISVFNFTKPGHEDFKRCWALENLQLLPAAENIRKSDRLYKPFQPSLTI